MTRARLLYVPPDPPPMSFAAYRALWIVGTVELGRGLTGILLDGWAEVAS